MFARSHPKPPLLAQKAREKWNTQTSVLARVPHVSQVFARRGDFDFVSCLLGATRNPHFSHKRRARNAAPRRVSLRGCPMSRRFLRDVGILTLFHVCRSHPKPPLLAQKAREK